MKDASVQTQLESSIGPKMLSSIPLMEQEFPQFLYQSHTVFWLQGCILLLGLISFSRTATDSSDNLRFGLSSAICLFLFLSAVHFPGSVFLNRPHPVVWRILQGASFCYLLALTFLLFQNQSDSRQLFTWLDSDLGKELPEKSYGVNCSIFTPDDPNSYFANVKDAIFDIHTLAHLIGWWGKMLIVRDVKLCVFLSGLFEFIEVSLKHQLPNFNECWWDSAVMDFILCNGGGIFLGWLTCRFFKMKEYDWGLGSDSNADVCSSLTKSARQLTPYTWLSYNWEIFSSSKNFVTTVWLIAFINLVDLSNFYLKFVLWIPANHWLVIGRTLFWAVHAMSATREYFEYVTSGFRLRLGTQCWISHLILAIEWMIIYKNSTGMFPEPMPLWLQYAWSLIIGLLIVIALRLFHRDLIGK